MRITEDIIYYWLSVSGLSARRANALLRRYTPLELWEGVGNTIADPGLFGDKVFDALVRYRNEAFLSRELEQLDAMQISFLPRNRFPERLAQPEVDPPILLYYRGNISLLDTGCVAVVGTRACSVYGKTAAERLSADLCGNGVTVVSGLASGIDTYAHRAAVKAGGKTVAVLGSGLNCVAPQSNAGLYADILASGGLAVSEYAPRQEAARFRFPERNRIISGISMGVIVVEAGERSGALITASYAAEQNRQVFAVPGNITSIKSVGSNRLLWDGALPALTADDVCDTLHLSFRKIEKKPRAIQLDIFGQKIYNILQSGDASFDALVVKTELPPHKLSAFLSALEIDGVIVKKQSNIYGLA